MSEKKINRSKLATMTSVADLITLKKEVYKRYRVAPFVTIYGRPNWWQLEELEE